MIGLDSCGYLLFETSDDFSNQSSLDAIRLDHDVSSNDDDNGHGNDNSDCKDDCDDLQHALLARTHSIQYGGTWSCKHCYFYYYY